MASVDRFLVEQKLTLDALKIEIFGHCPEETWHELLTLSGDSENWSVKRRQTGHTSH